MNEHDIQLLARSKSIEHYSHPFPRRRRVHPMTFVIVFLGFLAFIALLISAGGYI